MSKLFTQLKNNPELLLALSCGLFMAIGWVLEWQHLATASITAYILAYGTGGYIKTKEGISELIESRELNVDLLMMIAALGAAVIGYWEEGAMLIFIFALSGALETYTFNKSHAEISALLDLQPEEARRINTDGSESLVPVGELVVGDTVLIKPGERVPADGVIVTGATNLDEAAISGEPAPVEKTVGAEVFASTVNLRGSVTIRVTKLATETLFAKIITLVQNAQSEKSPGQLFIERWEGLYVKVVLGLVAVSIPFFYYIAGLEWSASVYRAMVLLIVASPCALVASITPAALSAISNGARQGILFKGGAQLEKIAKLSAIAFDKTGTLTQGKPVVTDVYVTDSMSESELLLLTASLESHATHPLAEAIINHAYITHGVIPTDISAIENHVGYGIQGDFEGKQYKIGKAGFFTGAPQDFHNGVAQKLQQDGKTLVYIGDDNDNILGLIALKDVTRPEAVTAIQSLNTIGIQTVMITGDNPQTAQLIAQEVGLSAYHASCLPADKVEHIKTLRAQGQVVAMIGDGINDAPALATADIGIAMGEGTDVALETADIVLMKNDLTRLAQAVKLSKRLKTITTQNVVFSLVVISTLITWNFVDTLPIPLAVIGHEGSTILVILNSLRLLRSKS